MRTVLWSKACNAAGVFGVTSVLRISTPRLFRDPHLIRAYLGLVRETAAIAAAHGVPVGDYTNFPIRTYVTRPDEETVAALSQKAFLAPAATGGVESFASMTQDLRAGRAIEVDDVFADSGRARRARPAWQSRGCASSAISCGASIPATRPAFDPGGRDARIRPLGPSSGNARLVDGTGAGPRRGASTWCWRVARSRPWAAPHPGGEAEVIDLQGRTPHARAHRLPRAPDVSGEPQEVERAATDAGAGPRLDGRRGRPGDPRRRRSPPCVTCGARRGVAIRLREAIAAGRLPGPRMRRGGAPSSA